MEKNLANVQGLLQTCAEKVASLETQVKNAGDQNQDFMKENIGIVNSIIFKNKLKYNYEVVDLHSIFTDKNGYLIDELTYDGLHLNDAGYSLWASTIKPIIDNI